MPRIIINICKPAHPLNADIFSAIIVNPTSRSIERIAVRHTELPIPTVDRCSEPQLILHDEWENFLVGDRIDIPDNQKILPVCNKLGNKFTKQGKRRIRHDDIGFLEKSHAFWTSKISITIKRCECIFLIRNQIFHIGKINPPILILISYLRDFYLVGLTRDLSRRCPRIHKRGKAHLSACIFKVREFRTTNRRGLIASRDELLQLQRIEIHCKILEKGTFIGIVTIAKNALSLKICTVIG